MKAAIWLLLAASGFLSPSLAHGDGKIIAIGFVGGFVRHDDPRHAEVRFAEYLRGRYGPNIDVEVFGNHSEGSAFRYVLSSLANGEPANIIIFGHSWGGTETVRLARALQQKHIPVLLTIQVDSIAKPGQENFTIPANVANAVNFYQSTGLLHGRAGIFAKDPDRTKIVGNFEMTYKDHSINCDEFPWYSRFFTRSHIEIENDPRVWKQAALLIDQELSGSGAGSQTVRSAAMRK